jgi:hypothetical protein
MDGQEEGKNPDDFHDDPQDTGFEKQPVLQGVVVRTGLHNDRKG